MTKTTIGRLPRLALIVGDELIEVEMAGAGANRSRAITVDQIRQSTGYQVSYESKEDLDGDLAWAAGSIARVFGDEVVGNRGVYKKSGASGSGSWIRIGDLPEAAIVNADIAFLSLRTSGMVGPVDAGDPSVTPPYIFFADGDGGVVAFGVGLDGDTYVRRIRLPYARDREFVAAVDDAAGQVAFGVDYTGRSWLRIRRDADLYLGPETIRGDYAGVMNVRPAGRFLTVATVQAGDGYICDVAQRRDVLSTLAAMAIEPGPIEMVLYIGQSNAGYGSGAVGGPVYTENLYPHHLFYVRDSGQSGGSGEDIYFGIRPDFLSATEFTGYGQSPAFVFGQALVRYDRDAGRRSPPRVTHTSWEGSQPLNNFFPGTSGHYLHENALGAVTRAKAHAPAYGKTVRVPAVIFDQGEAGVSSGTWNGLAGDYVDDVLPLYAGDDGVTPRFLFVQSSLGSDTSSASGIELAQLAFARSRSSPAVSLIGPTYQAPLHDTIHRTDLGRMMVAENAAIAYERAVIQGAAWNPLWPVSGGVTRAGSIVTIPMTLPPGATALSLDSDWVTGLTTYGFAYIRNGSPLTISSVAIVGTSVRLTLSADPGSLGTERVDYAIQNDTGDTGWATGRGGLYAESSHVSVYNRLGFNVPEIVRHYCVRFRETVS